MRCYRRLLDYLPGMPAMAVAALLLPALVFGQAYQWVDENGTVNYGDKPPEGVEAKPLNLPKGPSDKEVEKAQQELQNTLDARAAQSEQASKTPTASQSNERPPLPEFTCYTPILNVLRGPTQEAYVPIEPTAVTADQKRRVREVLSRAKGSWHGSSRELVCSGQIDAPNSEILKFDVRSMGTWREDQSMLVLENRQRGSRRRLDETRVSYIEVGEALYYFDAKGDGNLTVDRTISLRGNKAEGLYLDKTSLAFMSKRRSYHVMRTELRHLEIKGNRMEFTELYFHANLLTGSRIWTLTR